MNAQKIGLGVPALQLLPVTGGWTSALAFYHIALSGRVVYHRLSKSKVMGDRLDDSSTDLSNDVLYQSNRAHANLLENAPLALVLCAALELNGADRK
ncbi:hypothetical protein LTS18_013682, partial [Coniosporium uncinatum]